MLMLVTRDSEKQILSYQMFTLYRGFLCNKIFGRSLTTSFMHGCEPEIVLTYFFNHKKSLKTLMLCFLSGQKDKKKVRS